jgi:hypothetical protein
MLLGAGLSGLLGLPSAAGRTGGASPASAPANVVAANLEQLRAASPSNVSMIYNGAIFSWTGGDHRRPPLGPVDDVMVVKQDDTSPAVGAWVRQSNLLSVKTFGAVSGPLGSPAANTTAFRRALAAAAALGFPLHLDGGTYLLDADEAASGGVNFARPGLQIRGGGATLRFNGKGRAFVLIASLGPGGYLGGMSIDDIIIVGNAGVTDGFYSSGVVRSVFRNIEVRNVSAKAFNIKHGVANQYDSLRYSTNDSPQSYKPTHGIYLDNNDASNETGYYTANCTFTNTVMEGFPGTACHIEDGSGNLFLGGTFEGCATGLVVSKRSNDNMFVKVWMEANTVTDAVISGNSNGFLGPKFISFSFSGPNVQITDDGAGTWFAGGGYLRFVNIAAGSSGTTFHQIGVDVNEEGTIGFQGPGRYTRIGCNKIGPRNTVVGAYEDILGQVETIGSKGVWAPRVASAEGSITQNDSLTQGSFHKIGALVFAQCHIHVDSVRSPAGDLTIAPLPHRSACHQPGSAQVSGLQASATEFMQVHVNIGSVALSLTKLSGGRAMPMGGDVKAGTTIAASIVYTAVD